METLPTGGALSHHCGVRAAAGCSAGWRPILHGAVSVDANSREPAAKLAGAMTKESKWELEAYGTSGRSGCCLGCGAQTASWSEGSGP